MQDYVQLRAELRTKRHDELFAHGAQLAEGRGGLHNGAVAALGAPPPDSFYVKPAYPADDGVPPPLPAPTTAADGVTRAVTMDAPPSKQEGMTK